MLKIRLRRMGSRHRPFYRIVVSDSRKTPTASAVDAIGFYNPGTKPETLSIDRERYAYWVGCGAQVSETVVKLAKRFAKSPATVSAEAPAAAPAAEVEAQEPVETVIPEAAAAEAGPEEVAQA